MVLTRCCVIVVSHFTHSAFSPPSSPSQNWRLVSVALNTLTALAKYEPVASAIVAAGYV